MFNSSGVAFCFSLFLVFAQFHAGEALANDAQLQIITAKGEVTFNDKPVKVRDTLQGQGILKTGPGGNVKLFSKTARTLTILKENSAIEVGSSTKVPGNFKLIEGVSRWVVGTIKKDAPVVVTTKTAVMGIRGTEFMATYNPLLDETEIISFTGEIEFRPKKKPKKGKVIKTGQWGGLGGRFGGDIGDILDLPENVLTHFNKATALDTSLPGGEESSEFHGHKIPKEK